MALLDNLIFYLKLDEASGNAVDAHNVGPYDFTETSGTIGTATGIIDNARDFEGGDSEWLACADNADISAGDVDFSMFFWVNAETLDGSSGFPGLAAKGWDGSASAEQEWVVFQNGNGQPLAFAVRGTGVTQVNASTFGALSTSTWYFVACGHNATTNEIWISINAGTPNTSSHTTGVNDGNRDFVIGASSLQSLYWDGLIDEFAFFKRDIRDDLDEFYNGGAGLAYPFAASGTSPPEVPYRLRGGGIAEIAWPVWGQSFRF